MTTVCSVLDVDNFSRCTFVRMYFVRILRKDKITSMACVRCMFDFGAIRDMTNWNPYRPLRRETRSWGRWFAARSFLPCFQIAIDQQSNVAALLEVPSIFLAVRFCSLYQAMLTVDKFLFCYQLLFVIPSPFHQVRIFTLCVRLCRVYSKLKASNYSIISTNLINSSR